MVDKRLLIEEAHTYVGNDNIEELSLSRQVAKTVINLLKSSGQVIQSALIDDTGFEFLENIKIVDPWREYSIVKWRSSQKSRQILFDLGFAQDTKIFYEADYLDKGLEIIKELEARSIEQSSFTITDQGGGKYLKTANGNRIKIRGKEGIDLYKGQVPPSCQILDVAMYLKKLEAADHVITVIHENYKQQQDDVKQLLSIYLNQKDFPISIVYFNDLGDILNVDEWGQSLTILRKLIAIET